MNTGDAESGYLALRSEADLHSFRILARSMLMEQDKVEDERSGNGDYLEVWRTPDKKRTLSWIEAPGVFGRFLAYKGEDAENALKIASHALPSATAAEVQEVLRNSKPAHDELVALLHIAAYVTPSERPELLETYRRYLADPHRGIRLAAVRGYGIRNWPGLIDEVEKVSKEDPEPDIRDLATKVVDYARKQQRSNENRK